MLPVLLRLGSYGTLFPSHSNAHTAHKASLACRRGEIALLLHIKNGMHVRGHLGKLGTQWTLVQN